MPTFQTTLARRKYSFADLKTLLAKATPQRSGDELAGIAAQNDEERIAAQICLSDLPLKTFLSESVIDYDQDEITRLIMDESNNPNHLEAFKPVSSMTIGEFRNWLLSEKTDSSQLAALAPALTPEMVAAVSKIMRLQDLILVAKKCRVVTSFRNTLGLEGRLSTRLQPNHPTDDLKGIAASMLDGLLYGSGDAVIGVNPATDSLEKAIEILKMMDGIRSRFEIPTQTCVLTHVSTQIHAIERGAPIDLVFQSIGGTEATNRSFGVSLSLLTEAYEAALALNRGTLGTNVMYFETGQGSSLSANAHHKVDQQTCEARAYGVARKFKPLLVNSVVGFIGPEYLYNGKQITRAGLEDHFCAKLLGLPMGCDVCYTNHAEADQDDMDMLLTLLGVAGCTYIMGVPGADDVMLNYQSTSFHDALYARKVLNLKPAPEFESWLQRMRISDTQGRILQINAQNALLDQVDCVPPQKARPKSDVILDPWTSLKQFTPARLALGRTGESIPTFEHLQFELAHSQARSAVHSEVEFASLRKSLAEDPGLHCLEVRSAVQNRAEYLKRPDLGRNLDHSSLQDLKKFAQGAPVSSTKPHILLVISDGLSPLAINLHALPFVRLFHQDLLLEGLEIGAIILARESRVALADEIGQLLSASLVISLIGERPGLSNCESMSAYSTYKPKKGCTDAERNCISNICPNGLSLPLASKQLTRLASVTLKHQLSGVHLNSLLEKPAINPPR